MLVLAISTATISLLGGGVILCGATLITISYSESYKATEQGETLRMVGALVTSFGTAVAFLAQALKQAGTTEEVIAVIVCALVVGLLVGPRFVRMRADHQERLEGKPDSSAGKPNHPTSSNPIEPSVIQDGVPEQPEKVED